MSSLVVGGVPIPVAPGGISRDRLDGVDRARAFDQTYRASVTGNPKRDFIFSTPPIARQTADFIENVLSVVTAQTCSGDVIGGASNSFVRSEEFDNASWTKDGTTVTANAAAAPNGTTTADRIVDTATGASHGVIQAPGALTANTNQVSSVYAFPGERTWLFVQTVDKAGTVRNSWVNLSTGALGTVNAGHTITATSLAPLANGWYRITCLWNSGAGGTTPLVAFYMATADNTTTYAGDITKGFYLWGAQHNKDVSVVTSYTPTTTAAVSNLSISACSEITGWHPVRLSTGHSVILDFALREV